MMQLALDIHFRIVPWPQQITPLPESDDFFKVVLSKYANFHRCSPLLIKMFI
ncbi:Uncharacterised protein [Serratia odorifera]|uniref:Uncharacterized protein n=1 Tax=Serratia odorifera TaxID=618 RepID=A0A447KU27_SEROD|nr:Uncharacterised protein [Serratia odorifera]